LDFVMENYVDRYLRETGKVLEALDRSVLENMVSRLKHLRSCNGRLFLLGVGGSAANASHAVNDFRKIAHIEAYAPTDNVAELTARINDEGWDTCFFEWLNGSRLSSRDMIMVFSVGGGSETTSVNIVRAIDCAKAVGAQVLGVVSRDGGHTAQFADACIVIPPQSSDTITPLAESFQSVIWHLLATALAKEEKVA
jgi:D-sedoheptulose 7-phosphate isomerase